MNWLPPILAGAALAGAALAAAMWLRRERRAADQRRFLRALFAVCEDMFSAATPVEMLRRLQATLPRITGASTVALYLHNPVLETLDALPAGAVSREPPVPVRAAIGDDGGAIATCFRNRTMLPIAGAPPHFNPDAPGSQLLVPMLARGEAVGVLAIDRSGPGRPWQPDRQAAMQHLGNQIATALKLLEQQSIRERLFRSEKLAAAGQLISGVAAELRAPLATIDAQARLSLDGHPTPSALGEALHAIVEESAKASHLVERLVAFTDLRAAQLEPVDLNTLLAGLLDFRRQEWRVRGVQCRIATAPAPVVVAGSPSQLQQAFLNLLLHVEQSLAAAARTIDVAVSTLGKRALVRIVYPDGGSQPSADSLQVVHGVLLAHGGDLHPIAEGASHGFDIFLPLAEEEPVPPVGASPAAGRRLTTLVADPDPIARRELVRLLGQRRHRAVPCANAEEALDLIDRMPFDAVLCSVRQPGANWIELRDRSRSRVDAFVLLTEGLDHDLQRAISSSAFLLQKPFGASGLDDLLSRIQHRAARG